jgi:hypothetical protein
MSAAEKLVECAFLLDAEMQRNEQLRRTNAALRADVEELTEANRRLFDDLTSRTIERDAYSAVIDRGSFLGDEELHRWIS